MGETLGPFSPVDHDAPTPGNVREDTPLNTKDDSEDKSHCSL